jgi:hypothetical protein
MDPFSGLNISTSIVQFIEFGCSLVSQTRQIYKSPHGATISQVETTFAARRILELSERMKSSLRDQIPPEVPRYDHSTPAKKQESEKQLKEYNRVKQCLDALCQICDNCITLSKELEDKLIELRVQGPKHRRFKSIRQALKRVWSAEAICELEKRLDSHRRELKEHLLAATW